DVIVRAARIYALRLPHVRTVICGDGPLRAELERSTAGLRCEFTGAIDRRDVASLMSSASLYISPCPAEGFGMSTVQALLAGVPVLAARGGANAEIVAPEVGRLFAPDDPGELAKLVIEAIDDDWRSKIGVACKESARTRFGIDEHMTRLEAIYAAT